jgi:hypothetical protein
MFVAALQTLSSGIAVMFITKSASLLLNIPALKCGPTLPPTASYILHGVRDKKYWRRNFRIQSITHKEKRIPVSAVCEKKNAKKVWRPLRPKIGVMGVLLPKPDGALVLVVSGLKGLIYINEWMLLSLIS